MSYSPFGGYGDNYSNKQYPNAPNSYKSGRQSESERYPNLSTYANDNYQGYYGSSHHDWLGQSQPPDDGSEHLFGGNSWKNGGGQDTSYDCHGEPSDDAILAASESHAQNYYASTSTNSSGNDNQGLYNLAYASGLNNPFMKRPESLRQEANASTLSKYRSAAIHTVQNAAKSPTQSVLQQFSSTSQNAHVSLNLLATNAKSNIEISATAPDFVGTLSRCSPNGPGTSGDISTYQVMRASPSVPVQTPQRLSSPYSVSAQSQSQSRPPVSQLQSSHSKLSGENTQIPATIESTSMTPNQEPSKSLQYVRAPNRPSQSPTLRPNPQQLNGISNPVTQSPVGIYQPMFSAGIEQKTMLGYIEPSQVLNPYHKEHGSIKQEALRAKAEATAKASREAATKPNQSQEVITGPAANFGKTNKAGLEGLGTAEEPPTTTARSSSSKEDEKAAEMKIMMIKMKEFRNKDPSLFQKLWGDVQKGESFSSTAANSIQFPPPLTAQKQNCPTAQSSHGPLEIAETLEAATGAAQSPSSGCANGYRVMIEDNPELLPDLGRFPAERRIRASYKKRESTPNSTSILSERLMTESNAMVSFPNTPINPIQVSALQTQPSLPKSSAAGVAWHEKKRSTLAEVAFKVLKAIPENANVEMSEFEVHAVLAQNPSYVSLCELLEKKGFRFNRGHLARELLNNIPDLVAPQKEQQSSGIAHQPAAQTKPQQGTAVTQGRVVSNSPLSTVGPAALFGAPVHADPIQFRTTNIPSHVIKQEPRTFGLPGFGAGNAKCRPKSIVPLQSEPLLGSKEAMARKRDFSEVVDLTQLSDNEDYVMSHKQPRVSSPPPKPNPAQEFQMHNGAVDAGEIVHRTFIQPPGQLPNGAPMKFNPSPLHQAPTQPPPHQRANTILAKRIDKEKALRKSYYDPKTVARDILIAAGRHPTERPLNAHMAGLLTVHIDLDSDLSTFDWDAIDPGGPPPPKVPYADIPAGLQNFRLGRRGNKVRCVVDDDKEPRLPDSVNPGDLSASDRILMLSSLSHFSAQTKRLLSASVNSKHEHQKPRPRHSPAVDDGSQPPDKHVTAQKRKSSFISVNPSPGSQERTLRTSSLQTSQLVGSEKMEGSFHLSGKRRGRPPGHRNKHPSITAIRKVPETFPQVEIALPASSLQHHPVFKCKWIRCQASLHNLATLRRHVEKLHHSSDAIAGEYGHICWWKGCEYLSKDGEGNVTTTNPFETREEWMGHIQDVHLHAVAMRYGDGPSASTIGKPRSSGLDLSKFRHSPARSDARTFSYLDPQSSAQDRVRCLSDENGKTVTPTISMKGNKDLPADTLMLLPAKCKDADIVAHKSFLKAHRTDRMNPKSSAEETLRAMEARKARIGPGIDRGGCVLVNEARRSTLIQNQGLARVVDADY